MTSEAPRSLLSSRLMIRRGCAPRRDTTSRYHVEIQRRNTTPRYNVEIQRRDTKPTHRHPLYHVDVSWRGVAGSTGTIRAHRRCSCMQGLYDGAMCNMPLLLSLAALAHRHHPARSKLAGPKGETHGGLCTRSCLRKNGRVRSVIMRSIVYVHEREPWQTSRSRCRSVPGGRW